jgi:hypothetical protein
VTDGYDSFEQARIPVERLYELGAEISAEISASGFDSPRVAELEGEVRSLFAEDLENVTRDGIVRGPDHFISDWHVHLRRCEVNWTTEFHEGADAAVVATGDITSRLRDSPDDYLTRHSGAIYKVRDGKIVFFEGYPAASAAMRAASVRVGQA